MDPWPPRAPGARTKSGEGVKDVGIQGPSPETDPFPQAELAGRTRLSPLSDRLLRRRLEHRADGAAPHPGPGPQPPLSFGGGPSRYNGFGPRKPPTVTGGFLLAPGCPMSP